MLEKEEDPKSKASMGYSEILSQKMKNKNGAWLMAEPLSNIHESLGSILSTTHAHHIQQIAWRDVSNQGYTVTHNLAFQGPEYSRGGDTHRPWETITQ